MSQTTDLIKYLSKPGRTTTIYHAMVNLGIGSLHRRIADARKLGSFIHGKWVHKGKKSWKKYYLA